MKQPESFCEYGLPGLYGPGPGGECGAVAVGSYRVRALGFGGLGWQPFSYCEEHRDALHADLKGAGLVVAP